MKRYPTSKRQSSAIDIISRDDRRLLVISLAVMFTVTIIVLVTSVARLNAQVPDCFEDEVAVWSGESHDKCVPISKFEPVMTDTVVVDLEHCNETNDGYLKCEIDPWAHVTGEDA